MRGSALGLIGAGNLGLPFALRALQAGRRVVIYDKCESAVARAVGEGAQAARSIDSLLSELLATADCAPATVVSIVPNDAALRNVSDSLLTAAISASLTGASSARPVHISCSTVSPATSRAMSAAHVAAGVDFVAAPIFARPENMRSGEASFVVAGDNAAALALATEALTCAGKSHTPVFAHLRHSHFSSHAPPSSPPPRPPPNSMCAAPTERIFHFGDDPGAANAAKLSGNLLIACAIEGMAESLALAESEGVERQKLMEMLSSTIFDCAIYRGYGARVAQRDHRPGGFSLTLGLKDVSLALETAHRQGLPLPFGSILRDRFLSAAQAGHSDLDWSALGLLSVPSQTEIARESDGEKSADE